MAVCDQGVDVIDIEAIAGDVGAVDLDGQAGLAQFLHQRDIGDAAHLLQHLLDGLAFLLQHIEVGAEDLHRQRAFQAGLGFIDRVLGRLGVVEDDAGKGLPASG